MLKSNQGARHIDILLLDKIVLLNRSLSMMRKWQKALRENVSSSKTMNFIKDESPVFEELNVAWAGHELVSDHMDNALDWFATKVDGPKLMSAVNPRL